jgi:seryl-tRNA synthetase
VLDTKTLKTKPGEYVLAFYGKAVAKYRYNPEAIAIANAAFKRAQKKATELDAEARKLAKAVQSATADKKAAAQKASAAAKAAHKAATAAVRTADRQLKAAQKKAAPKDIVDIVVTKPITVRVKPAEKK